MLSDKADEVVKKLTSKGFVAIFGVEMGSSKRFFTSFRELQGISFFVQIFWGP